MRCDVIAHGIVAAAKELKLIYSNCLDYKVNETYSIS